MSCWPHRRVVQNGMKVCLCVSLPFGDFNLDTSARSSGIYSRHYAVHMLSQHRPLWITEHYECECANRQILLVTDIFARREEYLKSSLFSCLQKFSVLEFLLSSLGGCFDRMFFEEPTDGDGSPLVKEDEHQRVSVEEGALSRLRAANSITALTWSRSSPSGRIENTQLTQTAT
jgi:hypothetical protein